MTDIEGAPAQYARNEMLRPLLALGRAVRRRNARGPRLGLYAPVSTLDLPVHEPGRAAVAAIDFHAHLGRWLEPERRWMEEDVGRLIERMDRCNISAAVNLDGRWGRELDENLRRYDEAYPDRFFTFCHVDWRLLGRRDGPEELVRSLTASVAKGARGLKVWKDLGLEVQVLGRTILIDDPRLSPLWSAAGELGVPVLVHVGDPKAFFLPADRHNERLEELLRYPSLRHSGGLQAHRRLLESFEHMVADHPGTAVVAAHGLCAEDLAYVERMLARYPNLSIDIGWRAQELGRQPRAARSLLMSRSSQVLFGTDCFPGSEKAYRTYFRLLETADEAFDYPRDPGTSPCRWQMYGLDLPQEVLERVYRHNALKLLGRAYGDPRAGRPPWVTRHRSAPDEYPERLAVRSVSIQGAELGRGISL